MKSRSLPPQVVFFLLVAALGLIGRWLSIPIASNLVVMCLGLVCLVEGLRMIITRRASFSRPGRGYHEEYSGLAAQLWGVLFLFFAVLFCVPALATLFLPGGLESFLKQSLSTPAGWGVLVVGLGAFAAIYGIIRLLAGSATTRTGLIATLDNVGDWFLGGLALLFGLSLAGIGLALILTPDALTALIWQLTMAFVRQMSR